MLDGIDQIDWSRHAHAFGSADNLPGLLRDLAVGGDHAEDAVNELFNTIWHQGTVYEVTAVAVPFLGELAESDDVDIKTRDGLLHLLFAIGRGKGYWEVHADSAAHRASPPVDLPDQLGAELHWVRASKRAVEQIADAVLKRLGSCPARLWLPTAVLTVVAGETGRSLADEVASESVRRLSTFGSLGLAAVAELVTNGTVTREGVRALCTLDRDLAEFVADQEDFEQLDLSMDSYFVDVLVERICDADEAESPAS